MPRPGQVLGLVGTNGIGKSTALKIMSGKLKPNLGRFSVGALQLFGRVAGFLELNWTCLWNEQSPPDWEEILKYFRGSELQNFFTKILEDNIKAIIKPQYVDHIPKAVSGRVQAVLQAKTELDNAEEMIDLMGSWSRMAGANLKERNG